MQTQSTDRDTIRGLVRLFAEFAVVCLLAGCSRMFWKGWQMHPFGDVLRWREALSMFVFAPAISVVFWRFLKCVSRGKANPAAQILCVLTIYFVACGMGMHDPLNRMTMVYKAADMKPEVWRSIVWHDDGLSHWVFWGGFVLGSWTLGLQQAFTPLDAKMPRWAIAALSCITAVLLFVMFTNLAYEWPNTQEDCMVVLAAALVPAIASAVRWKTGLMRMPFNFVMVPLYLLTLASVWGWWLVKGLKIWG